MTQQDDKRRQMPRNDEEWRQALTTEQYHVLRKQGTEPPFSHSLYHEKRSGSYVCAGCGKMLFSSEEKFNSGTGWPSFFAPADSGAVDEHEDVSHGMRRTEVRCSACSGHLGHVFPDGPRPTGLRYCVNGMALKFMPKNSTDTKLQ